MAFETLNPFAALWSGHGLRYLLLPGHLRQTAVQPEVATAPKPARKPEAWRRPPPRRETPAPAAAKPDRSAPAWKPTPLADWPEQWREQFGRTKPGQVVWTYADIGKDLRAGRNHDPAEAAGAAEARARRSQILRRLLAELKFRPGTHTFWPCQFDDAPDPDLFWSGVTAMRSRYVIVFGGACATALVNAELAPLRWKMFRGHKIMALAEIDGFSESRFASSLSFLRSCMGGLFR